MSFVVNISSNKLWIRLAGIALGAGFLVWIPFEDTGVFWVLFFSVGVCGLGAAWFIAGRPAGQSGDFLRRAFAGGLAGLVVTPLAIGLMAFKSGLHGHGSPDFSVSQMRAVLGSFPYFTLSGLVLGLLSALWPCLNNTSNLSTQIRRTHRPGAGTVPGIKRFQRRSAVGQRRKDAKLK
jgi:hypothetical protein